MVDEPERLRDKLKTISQLMRNPRCIIFNHFQETSVLKKRSLGLDSKNDVAMSFLQL